MLEIRYNKNTKEVTGWWANRHGKYEVKLKNRRDEAMAMLDIPIPDKPLGAWLYDEATQNLIPNPDYFKPESAINLVTKIADLEARVENLEKK